MLRAMLSFGRAKLGISAAANTFQRNGVPPQHVPSAFRMPQCGSLDLFEITIEELQSLMSSGQLTAEQYAEFCLERIRQVRRISQ